MDFTIPIFDEYDTRMGVLAVKVNIHDILAQNISSVKGSVFLIDKKGEIV
ncbi:MAG: hypothetical protein GY932_04385 [Arcobacter sp.]|nr:hypothetical protein [Arcobacter sp.]